MTMRLLEMGEAVEEIASKLESDQPISDNEESRLSGLAVRAFGAAVLHTISALNRIADALEQRNGS